MAIDGNDANTKKALQLLRKSFNPQIDGPNTQAVLAALATNGGTLLYNVQAVSDNMYVVSASGRYVDQRLGDYGFTRPGNVGLQDEVFKELGLEVINRKQVRDLINNILETVYGVEYTRATASSTNIEPYALVDGDQLLIQFDDGPTTTLTFSAAQFSSIAAATAQEVSDAITRDLRAKGLNGSAQVVNDGAGNYVQIISPTTGPRSSLRVYGGRAQNALLFPMIRPTTGTLSTQWTLSVGNGGTVRATWTGGSNPSPGKTKAGDYVNTYGTSFNAANRGTFTITAAKGGTVGNAYVEFSNPLAVSETVVQGTDDAMLFFNPQRRTINSNINFAAAYQTQDKVLEVFLPAITRIVRRNQVGAVHLKPSATPLSTPNNQGSYMFDITKAYAIRKESGPTSQVVNAQTQGIITMTDSSQLPDEVGFVCFGFGTSHEEGPVPYLGRPSNNTLQIDPSYTFKKVHPSGTDVALIGQNAPYQPVKTGLDYPFYITDVVSGRVYAQSIIESVAALGINLVFVILYPNDVGLGRWGRDGSEKTDVFGE
jgi:hypothetical protein